MPASLEVSIKTRSPPASLPFRGQVTEQTTVKWSIRINTQPYFPKRMFQPVSRHNSEQSIAHYSSRPTVSQLVSPTLYQTYLRITNHRKHKFPPSLTLLLFKTRIQWPPVLTKTEHFPSFSAYTRSGARVKYSGAISLYQAQFFATHSNQCDCFICTHNRLRRARQSRQRPAFE